MPAASLANSIKLTNSSFLASPDAIYATTVSPAPETSKTSFAFEGIWKFSPFFLITEIPSGASSCYHRLETKILINFETFSMVTLFTTSYFFLIIPFD